MWVCVCVCVCVSVMGCWLGVVILISSCVAAPRAHIHTATQHTYLWFDLNGASHLADRYPPFLASLTRSLSCSLSRRFAPRLCLILSSHFGKTSRSFSFWFLVVSLLTSSLRSSFANPLTLASLVTVSLSPLEADYEDQRRRIQLMHTILMYACRCCCYPHSCPHPQFYPY